MEQVSAFLKPINALPVLFFPSKVNVGGRIDPPSPFTEDPFSGTGNVLRGRSERGFASNIVLEVLE